MNHPDIAQSLPRGAAADLADASTEPLNPKKVPLRKTSGHLEQEAAIATTYVQFEGTGGIGKERAWGKLGKIIRRDELHRRRREQGHAIIHWGFVVAGAGGALGEVAAGAGVGALRENVTETAIKAGALRYSSFRFLGSLAG